MSEDFIVLSIEEHALLKQKGEDWDSLMSSLFVSGVTINTLGKEWNELRADLYLDLTKDVSLANKILNVFNRGFVK